MSKKEEFSGCCGEGTGYEDVLKNSQKLIFFGEKKAAYLKLSVRLLFSLIEYETDSGLL